MSMPVMGIRHMGMTMPFRLVPMRVAVWAFGHWIVGVVVMPVFVTVCVLMVQRLVFMVMLVRLGQMHGHAQQHQQPAQCHAPAG